MLDSGAEVKDDKEMVDGAAAAGADNDESAIVVPVFPTGVE